jgi:cysteinyl-tRNA synthetase
LISSHYRSPINYSEDNLKEAKAGLERFYKCLLGHEAIPALSLAELQKTESYKVFAENMDDDFNVREGLAVMYGLVRDINNGEAVQQKIAELKAFGHLLGFLQEDPQTFLQAGAKEDLSAAAIEQKSLIVWLQSWQKIMHWLTRSARIYWRKVWFSKIRVKVRAGAGNKTNRAIDE